MMAVVTGQSIPSTNYNGNASNYSGITSFDEDSFIAIGSTTNSNPTDTFRKEEILI